MEVSIPVKEERSEKQNQMPKQQNEEEKDAAEDVDYQQRGQWLRAAVLGANDGLLTTASLMVGVGAVSSEGKTMVLSGLASLVAGASSMAIGEYVSVCTQRDIESAALVRRRVANCESACPKAEEKDSFPSPWKAAGASAAAFAVGALVPLLSAAFVSGYMARICVLAGTATVSLALFGGVGAHYGGASAVKGSLRVLVGGWIAILFTFGVLKLFGTSVSL